MSTVIATDPPPANSPTRHSRKVCKEPKHDFFEKLKNSLKRSEIFSLLKHKINKTIFDQSSPVHQEEGFS